MEMRTRIVSAAGGIAEAAALLRAGEVVAFPTETVYGLGADARSDGAIGKIYAAKGRPAGNPVIVHVATLAAARACVSAWPAVAGRLAEVFWPGPLTMILPRSGGVSRMVSAGRETVAIRCPRHPVALELLNVFGGPVAAPSANRSGFTSPTTAGHVFAELEGRVPLIVDGGACELGVESTVVDLTGAVARVLRPGSVTVEMLQEVVPGVEVVVAEVGMGESAVSPGLHHRHYAPRTAAYRFEAGAWAAARAFAEREGPVALITWAEGISLGAPHQTLRLPGDGEGYARVLYGALREADGLGVRVILVVEPPTRAGVWAAVADRLRRATEVLYDGARPDEPIA